MKLFRILTIHWVLILLAPVVQASDERDPWEGFNRAIFAFNEAADTYVVRPVAVGYEKVTPVWCAGSWQYV